MLLITVEVAISVVASMTLLAVAAILRDALVLATTGVLESIAELLPPGADVTQAETHLVTPVNDGIGKTRQNSLRERINLEQLGPQSRDPGSSMGFAARISEPLGEQAAAELVIGAIENMALANGFLDPRTGLATLRSDLERAP